MMGLVVGCLIVAPLTGGLLAEVPALRKAAGPIALLAAFVTLVAAASIAVTVRSDGPQSAFDGWIYVDSLGVVFLVLIAVVGVCATPRGR
jgi:formate hydrogenlyase subunit 3/multisubunit Na+/H+ antiporter MnhD subunit